jgi:hypothetical protein
VIYTKLNEVEKPYLVILNYSIYYYRWYANNHVTTWCIMQTSIWMSDSDSTHFYEQFSYKILFVSNYGLRDMN